MNMIWSEALSASDFLAQAEQFNIPIIDVRSPQEFAHGHIPSAHNIPLFTDDERAQVGTKYKNAGKEKAILLGLELVGPKLSIFIQRAQKILRQHPPRTGHEQKIFIHCWRGGMRSQSMAWLLSLVGIKSICMENGYKAYRKIVLDSFQRPIPQLTILGGMTGSGKTDFLHQLQEAGEQIIDLEKLANHKGSAFGFLGQEEQPTTEQFENNLHHSLCKLNFHKRIWVEDEGRCIGSIHLPQSLFDQIRRGPVINIEVPIDIRVERLFIEYGHFSPDNLSQCVFKLRQRLGGLKTKLALKAIENGDIRYAIKEVLAYYDKTYQFGLSKREKNNVNSLPFLTLETTNFIYELIHFAETNSAGFFRNISCPDRTSVLR